MSVSSVDPKAVARFFVTGGWGRGGGGGAGNEASEVGESVLGVRGHARPENFESRRSEKLFSPFSTRYFVKKSISIKCKLTGIFRAYRNICEVCKVDTLSTLNRYR